MHELGATIEYIVEAEIANYDVCFYHIIDNVNVTVAEINASLAPINPAYNMRKLKDNTIYITAHF